MWNLRRKIFKAATIARENPINFFRLFKPYVLPHIVKPRSGEMILGEDVRFEVDIDLDPTVKEMYYHVYELELVSLLDKFLWPGDVFVDVGANIGYISAYGLARVGRGGQVHSFEPIPGPFARLQQLKEANPGYQHHVTNAALGNEPGMAKIAITNLRNIGWNTMVPGFMAEDATAQQIDVPVMRLDDYLQKHDLDTVRLFKIDTEGFELPVLKGLSKYFERCRRKPLFIIEVAPGAYPKLGTSMDELFEFMRGHGYRALHVDLKTRAEPATVPSTMDVIFMPDR